MVPDVKGMSVSEAEKMFRDQGLTYVVSDSNYVKNKPSGIILDLNPSVGQKVKEGRTIYLTINTLSTPLCVVPDVAAVSYTHLNGTFQQEVYTVDQVVGNRVLVESFLIHKDIVFTFFI